MSSTPVRMAAGIPQTFLPGPVDPGRVRAFLRRIEALGFESAWVVDHTLGTVPSLEPLTLLTFAAASTERIRLGSAVLLTGLRSPVHLAHTVASLDHLSGGRLILGVGLGGNPRVYPIIGLPPARRVARFTEGLGLMRALWTEPRVTWAGDFWQLESASLEPKPLQRPHPPIWFGAHHPDALRRAVRLGAGFMGAGSAATAAFAEQMGVVRRLLGEAGRDPATLDVGKRVYVALDADRARAGRRLAEWFGAYYGRAELAAEVAVFGGRDECVTGLRAVRDAGARLLMLNPVFDELEQIEAFATEIVPAL